MTWLAGATVRIAGAGPAGLATALAAARLGHRVVVVERAPRVAARFSGGLQMIENFSRSRDALEELAALGFEGPPVVRLGTETAIGTADGIVTTLRSARPMGYFVLRGPGPGTLDTWLERRCRDAGVELRFGEVAREGEVDVVATGPKRLSGLAIETTWAVDGQAEPIADVRFDDRLAPRGFTYCFRAAGVLTIGLGFRGEYPRAAEFLDRTIAVHARDNGLALPTTGGTRRAGFMEFRRLPREAPPGPLRVGEAAGVQDMIFGLGIRKMISTGVLSATSRGDAAEYHRSLLAAHGAEMARGVRARALLERVGVGRIPALVRLLGFLPGRTLLRLLYG